MKKVTLSHLDQHHSHSKRQWEIFKCHHEENLGLKIKLPGPEESILYSSATAIYNLNILESHLVCKTRKLMDDNSKDKFDFSDVVSLYAYDSDDVIDLFFMLSREDIYEYNYVFHKEKSCIGAGFLSLLSYTAPSLLREMFSKMYGSLSRASTLDKNTPEYPNRLDNLIKFAIVGINLYCISPKHLQALIKYITKNILIIYTAINSESVIYILNMLPDDKEATECIKVLKSDNRAEVEAYQTKMQPNIPILPFKDLARQYFSEMKLSLAYQ